MTLRDRILNAKQPHIHPAPGPLDARGNCPGCAAYEAPVVESPWVRRARAGTLPAKAV